MELDRFYAAFAAGKRPKLAIMSPPQHGKSWAAEDFIAWVAGKNPDLKTIYTSYSEDLGTLRNPWPRGKTLDQIDAAAMAFAHLTAGSTYDHTYAGFQ